MQDSPRMDAWAVSCSKGAGHFEVLQPPSPARDRRISLQLLASVLHGALSKGT